MLHYILIQGEIISKMWKHFLWWLKNLFLRTTCLISIKHNMKNSFACIIAVLLSSLLLFKWAIGPRALLHEKRGSIPTSGSVTACSPSPALTDLSGKSIACYNPASCTASTCCMEIDRFNGRSVEVDLDFNECANYMDLTLERVYVRMYITDLSLNGMLNSVSQVLICY